MAGQDESEYRSVADLKSALDLNKKVDRLKASRSRLQNQWQLNLNFFNGRQYCYYSPKLNKIVSLPTQEGEKPRYRIRVTSNRILQNSLRLLAKMTKTKPMFFATSGSSDPAAVKAAQVAESLAEHWWFHLGIARKYAHAMLLAIIMGSGFFFISWDKLCGEGQTYLMQPDPKTGGPSDTPMVNDALKELFCEQLDQAGIPRSMFEKTVFPGDISVEVMDPRNVFLDDTVTNAEDAEWWILRRHMSPDDIKAHWGKDFEPDSVPESGEPVSIFAAQVQQEKSTKAVYCLYLKPSAKNKKGRYCCWADDTILEDGDYPLPPGTEPLIRFGSVRHPLNPYGSSVVEHAIDDQKEYNRVLSKIIESLMLLLTPRFWAPIGSIRGRVTNEPGQILEYVPQQGLKPEPEAMQPIPPYVFEHAASIKERLDEDFFLNEIGNGTPPPNVEAGVAIDLLQEAASDTFAPIILDNEQALSKALMTMLALARVYYTEPRMIEMTGMNGSSKIESFRMTDMTPGIRIAVETGSSMPRTRASRMAMVMEMLKQGLIPQDQAWKYLDSPDLKQLSIKMQSDEDQALREHDKLMNGQPINPLAFQQAMQSVQTPDPASGVPINPETNRPFQDAQEVQEFLKNAALQPLMYENSSVHLDVMSTYMKSLEYEQLPDHIRSDFETHYGLTLDRYLKMNPLPENMRLNYQIKATTGPTAAAQILTQAGVQGITPDVMAEPPLETWVSETMSDEGAMGAAGNQPLEMMNLEKQKAAADMAQQQAQMAQQQMQQVDQMHQAEQQRTHAQQAHEQKLSHADQLHQAKLKQMNKPKAPAGGKA